MVRFSGVLYIYMYISDKRDYSYNFQFKNVRTRRSTNPFKTTAKTCFRKLFIFGIKSCYGHWELTL